MTAMPSNLAQRFAPLGSVQLRGVLGEALEANHRGRLSTFIVDESSPAIAIFHSDTARNNEAGDWYGEHAGKWLYAAARAAARTRDEALSERVRRVADYLVGLQGADGYLGNYAQHRRFMHKQPPKPETWDGAPALRTWDVWTHAYLMLGLLEVNRNEPHARYLDAARKIGDLFVRTLSDNIAITELGNHHGLSATVLIDPVVDLYSATGDSRYLDLARLILEQAERDPRSALLTQALLGADASEIATGKAYQLLWNMVGLAKLYVATGEARLLHAVEKVWRNVRDHHLTLGGGPWGGVAHRSREVFNARGTFSPQAYVETCSILAWLQLNRELLSITGDARYAEQIERCAYNDLLGAQAPNGEDWCYYSFPNGRRVHTTYWRCCKSSGAMALEELSLLAYASIGERGIAINLITPSSCELEIPAVGRVTLEQQTRLPFEGHVTIKIKVATPSKFALYVRIPEWATEPFDVHVNGTLLNGAVAGTYLKIERRWHDGDALMLSFPMQPRLHRMIHRNVQESKAPDGSDVAQEVLRFEYVAFTCGPLVYATDLIDGFKVEETIRLADTPQAEWLRMLPANDVENNLELRPLGRAPILFSPYYQVGGRRDHAWRLTWLSLAPEIR